MGDTEEISLKRVAVGLALGHLAAAYSFTASALLLGIITDPAASQPRIPGAWWTVVKALAFAPFEAAIISILTFFFMLPASLLTAPFTYFAARHLQSEIVTTLAVGAMIGAAEVGAFLAWDGGFHGRWTRPGLPGDPRTDMMFVACGVTAGLAYAGVVWRLCVRPRLCRQAGVR